jgi:hypothetical protein
LHTTKFQCIYKGCKAWYTTSALLADHAATEHLCGHLNCTTQCKNQVALKEHEKYKHGPHCQVSCLGILYSNSNDHLIQIDNIVIGQTYKLNRNMDTDTFQCPICSYTTSTTRSIQKHCKDHTLNSTGKDSTGKHTTSRYHPYTAAVNNATGDNISDIPDDINTDQMQDSNAMDIEGRTLYLTFFYLSANNINPHHKMLRHRFKHKAHHSIQLLFCHHSTFRFTWYSRS